MKFPRSSGVLLHLTSLPGRFGIGDLGPAAHVDIPGRVWPALVASFAIRIDC